MLHVKIAKMPDLRGFGGPLWAPAALLGLEGGCEAGHFGLGDNAMLLALLLHPLDLLVAVGFLAVGREFAVDALVVVGLPVELAEPSAWEDDGAKTMQGTLALLGAHLLLVARGLGDEHNLS